ncbi:MAG TPA: diaminopropionate ammonia-lyase [Acetobacteraceae bacterium]|nr:diaminopropionate ammonia-lyase [Acetobacteraceae bacterium]
MSAPDSFTFLINPRHGTPGVAVLPNRGFVRAKEAITGWPGYAPTPLRDLPDIARDTGVAALRLKDEGPRFGLGSFKALGGAYAVSKLLAAELSHQGIARSATSADLADGQHAASTSQITVTCATDGNHGRSVAWGAQRFHCRCVIFVHETVSQGRVDAIAQFGAQVIRVPGNYDDAVREAESQARRNGWLVVSDTSYPGYTEVPRDVMQGYRLMADEAADQWAGPPPTHVFMQAGVGGAAAAISVQLRCRFDPAPLLIVVEPQNAACLLASAKAGTPTVVHGDLETIMAGLACGEPSLLAWQELERATFAFMSVPDEAAARALRRLADSGIAIGESGVAGLAGLTLAAHDPATRTALQLTGASRVLLFGTEGITDPDVYHKLFHSRRS